jgi:hypothetical protein
MLLRGRDRERLDSGHSRGEHQDDCEGELHLRRFNSAFGVAGP